MSSRPTVFIHTNRKQLIGAIVSAHTMRRNSRSADRFDVRILEADDHEWLTAREGQLYLRDGKRSRWRMNDLQSFTPLRFLPPELMGYAGRALLVDPDVFGVGDVWPLLAMDMSDRSILCRRRDASREKKVRYASSVMLLDCAKLGHWDARAGFDEMFRFERDYTDWVCLLLEPPESIGPLDTIWNDFDNLDERTRLLHNTTRETQPWKTGLPVDFTVSRPTVRIHSPRTWKRWALWRIRRGAPAVSHYLPHPDPRQESFFFAMLRECLDSGQITEQDLREAIGNNHIRRDVFEVLERTRQVPGGGLAP